MKENHDTNVFFRHPPDLDTGRCMMTNCNHELHHGENDMPINTHLLNTARLLTTARLSTATLFRF